MVKRENVCKYFVRNVLAKMLNLILSIHEVWANVSFMSLIIYLPQEGEGSGLYALNRN